YCDLRPNGTVAKGFITELSVGRNDTYSCFVCRMTERVKLPDGAVATVVGFPHVEKDGHAVMCSQAAISCVAEFWNSKRPGSFPSITGPSISKNVATKRGQKKKLGQGMAIMDMVRFFKNHNFTCFDTPPYHGLTLDATRERNPSLAIYGYLESGFPVIALVK